MAIIHGPTPFVIVLINKKQALAEKNNLTIENFDIDTI